MRMSINISSGKNH